VLVLVELGLDCPSLPAGPSPALVCHAFRVGVASLYHKAEDDRMENKPIVKTALCQPYEIFYGLGRGVWKELESNVAKFCLYPTSCCHADGEHWREI
jgi:hypothetical protein